LSIDGPGHWHGSIEHIVYTALGVLVVFHVARVLASHMATANSPMVSAVGKSLGAIVSFPAQ